jgi:glycosyltransferase involved in cell wall biosynthesis
MDHEPLPTVSIVIPARNESETIGDAVASALDQSYQGDIEVVVAVAPSSDGTRETVGNMAAADPRVSVVDNPAGSTPAGLNAAIRASRGTVIVRCDAHSRLPDDYVSKAVHRLQETGATNVGGVQAATGTTAMQRAIAAAMSSPFGVGDARFHMGGTAGPVDTVYLGVFRREAIETAGLFDEALARNQDYELNHRLRAAGGTVYFDPDLVVEYRPRAGLGSLGKQYFDYGRWKRVVVGMHPESLRGRQLVAPAFVLGVGASGVAALLGRPRLALVIPALYAAATLAATAVDLIRRRDAAMMLLPAVYPTMHLAWGTGFLMPGQPSSESSEA